MFGGLNDRCVQVRGLQLLRLVFQFHVMILDHLHTRVVFLELQRPVIGTLRYVKPSYLSLDQHLRL